MMENTIKDFLNVHKREILTAVIVLSAFLLRAGIAAVTDDFHGISNGRILQAEKILAAPGEYILWCNPVHPPLHILLLVLGLKLYNNVLITPRLISLLFGVLTMVSLYFFLKKTFSRAVAFFSLIALAIYSQHIAYSVIATSETVFHFFFFTGLLLLAVFFEKEEQGVLFWAGVFFGLSAMARYEGLAAVPAVWFFLKGRARAKGIFLLGACLLPLAWMLLNKIVWGNPLEFISTNDVTVPAQFNWIRQQGEQIDLWYKILFWPRSLMETLGIPVFFSGVSGIVYSLMRREKLLPAGIFAFFFLLFVFMTCQERLYLQPRYGITLGLLLIPFSVFMFLKIIARLKRDVPDWIVLILLWSMIPAIGKVILEEPLYIPQFAKDTACYIKQKAKKEDNIIIDHCGDEKYREPIKVLSGINPRRFVIEDYNFFKDGKCVVDSNRFFYLLENYNVTMLVYSPYGALSSVLALKNDTRPQEKGNHVFSLCYANELYGIYRVRKKQ
ncbi:MAG: glycosyltransferase family 39 protein [Candidatus Omnitrophica bacterium]|nr:glycosyltransferase family 39 protein [Candidatus Omnitrophota bacterium]MBU4478032.1 glycosyltransferase family 39 protein [Candidatus Omnitrophota bacterium]MCG2703640.1 glycosyltransferase family 39 protein [Candidatus Omnitrophota bacterium]